MMTSAPLLTSSARQRGKVENVSTRAQGLVSEMLSRTACSAAVMVIIGVLLLGRQRLKVAGGARRPRARLIASRASAPRRIPGCSKNVHGAFFAKPLLCKFDRSSIIARHTY